MSPDPRRPADSVAAAAAFDRTAEIVQLAERTPIARAPIAALAATLGGALDRVDLEAAIERALGGPSPEAAAALMLAAAELGRPARADQIARAVQRLESIMEIVVLLGTYAGDRLKLLLELAEDERLWLDVRAVAVFLATENLPPGGRPPERLLAQARLLCRQLGPRMSLREETERVLGLAASRLGDPAVLEIAGEYAEMDRDPEAVALGNNLLDAFRGPPSRVLPERPLRRVEPAPIPIRHGAPKVGRNDPCPCGSGKKFKKCCDAIDRGSNGENGAARPAANPQSGAPAARARGADGAALADAIARMKRIDLARFAPDEIERVDVERLPLGHANAVFQRLLELRRFEAAERAVEAMARVHKLSDSELDNYRLDIILEALHLNALEVARRQIGFLRTHDENNDKGGVRLELALAERGQACPVEVLEREALRVLRNNEDPVRLAYILLRRLPALGILVARAAVDPDCSLDSDLLLDAIEEARDRLLLPPGDVAAERYEKLLDAVPFEGTGEEGEGSEARVGEERGGRAEEGENAAKGEEKAAAEAREERRRSDRGERYREEAKALRAEIARLATRQRELERQLAAREEALREAHEALEAQREAAADPDTVRRLRAKVEEFRARIEEGNAERRELRRRLAELEGRVQEQEDDPRERGAARPDSDDPDDGAEEDAPLPATGILLPRFAPRFREDLAGESPDLARRAIERVGALAAGNAAAWRGVKRLQASREIWSARIGIHHRLLFRIPPEGGTLEVLAFIQRRDLAVAIRGLKV